MPSSSSSSFSSSPEPAPRKTDDQVQSEFTSYYLQRATKEFAEDLDKVRNADDFKADTAVQMLVAALQQGTGMFSLEEQRRIVDGLKRA
ncbi:ribosome assembly protein 3 [Cladorrhinum samala]|uniref:Ribosome assembly protein 3 n=1 Tax=Cladorrhinum samala TaxID=585594 RepID=A0AAV9HV43_9PEZI|nr:ribosome assembly protein 3 [Cladorrhinum samala]